MRNILKGVWSKSGGVEESGNISKDFGLVAWLENTRVRLPLRGVECRFEVCGDIASVKLEQVFYQNNAQALNCLYSFPLPGNAAVYSCEVQIGARTIVAKVEEAQKARRIYQEKVAAGHRASLVEMERDNLFTLSLGNLQPKDVVVVKLAYFQTLDRVGKQLSLLIPFCPGVRYIPGFQVGRTPQGQGTVQDTDQVPDASRITPPRMPAEHEDAAYVNIEGTLVGTDVLVDKLVSPLHKIRSEQSANTVNVRIDMESAIPDRDFVLRWEEKPSTQAQGRAWVCAGDKESYALVQLIAPEVVQEQDSYEQDHYFLVDHSGSMQGEKWHKTALALQAFMRRLGRNDRVWITLFCDQFNDFADRPLSKDEILGDPEFAKIEKVGADGGTELLPALEHVLKQIEKYSLIQERNATVVLITDGQVGNEDTICKALKTYPQVPLFAFGIDMTVNDAFLRNLVRQQRGEVVFQTPAEDIAGAVEALAAKLGKPVVTQVQVGKGWEAADAGVQNLYEGSLVDVALRNTKPGADLAISGRLPDGAKYQFGFHPSTVMNAAVKLLWVKNRMTWLLDNRRDREAIELAIQHNVLCRGTSFIAWDATEKVAVAKQELYQPSLELRYMESAVHCVASRAFDTFYARHKDVHQMDRLIARMAEFEPPEMSQPWYEGGLEQLPVFQKRSGRRVFTMLSAWVKSDAALAQARSKAWQKLEADLLRYRDDGEVCKKLLEEFVRREMSAKFEKLVQWLADELRKVGNDPVNCERLCKKFVQDLKSEASTQLLNLIQRI